MGITLEVRNLTKHFGAVRAAEDLTVVLRDGEVVGMMGANGAGKTTFLNLITGYVKPTRGRILYRGMDITGLPPRAVTRLGIARSFQIPQLFSELTVLENVLLALASRDGKALQMRGALWDPGRVREATESLDAFGLAHCARQLVNQLPEGARKLLDVAMAFVLRPRLLLMDEPTSGVSEKDKFLVMDAIVAVLRQHGVTALFVEHDVTVIQRYGERVLVLNEGRLLADGSPARVFADAGVRQLVLGYAGR